MNESAEFEYLDKRTNANLRVAAGIVTSVAALFNLIVDGGVAMLLWRLRPLRGSFAVLYMSLVTMECFNLLQPLLWVGPVVAFNATELGRGDLGFAFGHLGSLVWNVIVLHMVALAANRYLAIAMPLQPFFVKNCGIYTSPAHLSIVFSFNLCGRVVWWHCFGSCCFALALLLMFNGATLMHMRRSRQKLFTDDSIKLTDNNETGMSTIKNARERIQNRSTLALTGLLRAAASAHRSLRRSASTNNPQSLTHRNSRRAITRQRREIRLFAQTLLNACVYGGMVVSFHITIVFTRDPLVHYLLGTLPLTFCHGSNGLIMLLVNEELRRSFRAWLRSRWQS